MLISLTNSDYWHHRSHSNKPTPMNFSVYYKYHHAHTPDPSSLPPSTGPLGHDGITL